MVYEIPHPHDLQNVGPLASSPSHLLPGEKERKNSLSLSRGERVSAMCRQVRGYFGCGFAALRYKPSLGMLARSKSRAQCKVVVSFGSGMGVPPMIGHGQEKL